MTSQHRTMPGKMTSKHSSQSNSVQATGWKTPGSPVAITVTNTAGLDWNNSSRRRGLWNGIACLAPIKFGDFLVCQKGIIFTPQEVTCSVLLPFIASRCLPVYMWRCNVANAVKPGFRTYDVNNDNYVSFIIEFHVLTSSTQLPKSLNRWEKWGF